MISYIQNPKNDCGNLSIIAFGIYINHFDSFDDITFSFELQKYVAKGIKERYK